MINVKFEILPHYKESDLVLIKKSLVSGKIIYPKLEIAKNNLVFVKKGATIFTITGENDDAIELVDTLPKLELNNIYMISGIGKLITQKSNSKEYYAEISGILYYSNNRISIVPLNTEVYWEIFFNDDNTEVYLNIYPGLRDFSKPDVEKIFTDIENKKVQSRILKEEIKSAVEKLMTEKKTQKKVLVSKGKLSIDGKDSKIEFLVDVETDFKPQLTEDGRVDFYNLHTMHPIEKDQELAIFHRHQDGVEGEDVFGNKLEPKAAVQKPFPAGRNTYQDTEKPNLIRASTSGNLVYLKEILSVDDVMRVNGNVDFSTGNIDTKGSLIVAGNVKSGFEIKVENNAEIKGHIEDANVYVGGNISVKSGFYGEGKAELKAEGKVDIKYVHSQKIFSRDSINVTHEVIDSELYALNKVQIIGGKNMAVYGGKLIAGDYVEANCIGNEYGVNTVVEAGYDYENLFTLKENEKNIHLTSENILNLEAEIEKIKSVMGLKLENLKIFNMIVEQKRKIYKENLNLDEQKEQLDKLDDFLKKFLIQSRLNKKISDQLKEIFTEYFDSFHNLVKYKSENDELNKLIYEPSSAKIKINKYVFPGVQLMINKRRFQIEEKLQNKTFVLSKDEDTILIV